MLMVSLKYARNPILWLQKGNVSNQREHIVHLLANEQSRLGKLSGNEPVCVFTVSVSHEFSFLIIFCLIDVLLNNIEMQAQQRKLL
jgi:callose synthase